VSQRQQKSLRLIIASLRLRDYMYLSSFVARQRVMNNKARFCRLSTPASTNLFPTPEWLPPRVRVMTMHGAKGLSGRVVFIPGLEEEILPGPWRQPFPGLVLEAARLLYVSVTRARAACVLSFARTRMVNGQFTNHTPSRFCPNLGGSFSQRTDSFTSAEIGVIAQDCSNL
jgi:superfamily I DNA/RNA helicase